MSYIFAHLKLTVRRWGWIMLMPVLAVCSASEPTSTIDATPGTVPDLSVTATSEASATLSFSQVTDGLGQPANYDVRYAAGTLSWGSASPVASGSCSTPLTGTAVGSNLSCTVLGLAPSTSYNFQVKAFRGTLNQNAVFGGLSNVAVASTKAVGSPPPVPTAVTVTPPSASIAVGATATLVATVTDAQGGVMPGQAIAWSTSNSGAASVNSNGVVTGVAGGSATITATSSGKSGTSSITVTAAPPPPPVVTTVTVSPASTSVAAGATVGLTATVKDQNGNVMTGQTVTWTTSNAAAATVSSSGVVTGVAAGSATITATSSGKSGTSSITVTAVTPPPPPPPGELFHENFEDSNLGSRGWYDNTNILLNTTEHISGSVSSAEFKFLQGATTPTSGDARRHKFPASNSIYISYYVKYSTNWVGSGQSYHPHEIYVLSTMDGDYDGPSSNYLTLYLEHNYQNGGKPVMSIQDNRNINTSYGSLPRDLTNVTETRSTAGCNGMAEANMYSECFNAGSSWYNLKQLAGPVTFLPNPGVGYKNNWNFVEAYYQLNTVVNGIGQKDGVMQYWFNGTLVIDRHDILFRTGAHPTIQFNQFLIGPYIGDGSPANQSIFIDNLRVGTARLP